MKLPFSKYHGCGNDFILFTKRDLDVRGVLQQQYGELARSSCHRKLGIGADGMIVVCEAPLEMLFYNCDGSSAPMCGNGIRCFARFCSDEVIVTQTDFDVITQAGTMEVHLDYDPLFTVKVCMGRADFNPQSFGVNGKGGDFIEQNITVHNKTVKLSSCFLGTIHTVVFLEELPGRTTGRVNFDETSEGYKELEALGKALECHGIFTQKTNVNMVEIIDRHTLKLQTYERGVGMTCACGTGACASVVLGALTGKCEGFADVILPFGKLHIEQEQDGTVYMTGPAEKICSGMWQHI